MKARGKHNGRSRENGTGVAFAGTVFVHAAFAGMLWQAPDHFELPSVPVYRVELVAAPRPEPEARKAPEAVQRQAEPVAPAPTPRRTSVAEETPPTPPDDVEREPAPRTTPDVEPEDEPSTGTDPATVKIDGVAFAYPAYLRNVVSQVYRRWQRPERNVSLRAEVLFFVHRDGSISGFQFTRRSGNFAFDLAAQGAVESAGNGLAFGPLPDGYPDDVLPVNFFFDPSTLKQGRS